VTLNSADRRRIALATVVSLVALPALWLMQQDDPAPGSPGVAAAGVDGGLPAPAEASGDPGATVLQPADPAYLGSPLTTPPSPEVLTINVPSADVTGVVPGRAHYRRITDTDRPRPCASPVAPLHVELTVRNVDNGRSTTCVNVSIAPLDPGIVVVLHTDVFLEIADLVEAPLPVELAW
jgi:hypothetical protein